MGGYYARDQLPSREGIPLFSLSKLHCINNRFIEEHSDILRIYRPKVPKNH
jgi:hypothetical protein